MLSLVFSLLALGHVPDSLLGPGVSRELAQLRARSIANVRYDLMLDVTRRDTAVGHVTIRFESRSAGDVILDFRGYSAAFAKVNGAAATLSVNQAHIVVPGGLVKRGENSVELDFRSAIAPSGASIIRYHDVTDNSDYLYTLLVPADANALFPCFDQPDLKARVTLSLATPVSWTAVANGSIARADSAGQGRTFHFTETKPLSTYLIAFAAGPWKTVTSSRDGRSITMYVRASRAGEAEADSLPDANRRALEWLGEYFGRPYGFEKFDFVLAPAFPFGGMEHPGAIFYNEESFIYRERPTATQRIGRQATIFHEVAHQWFGDLVTMRWFDDLWLKEGFATYMAAKMQAAVEPRAEPWKTFYLRNKPVAYDVDVTSGTTPVWQSLGNLDQAKSNYGAIVYNKAPSVLKQLNYLVGDSAFQAGLRDFLRAHEYGNATWQDLLASISAASGKSLTEWGRQYILRPGLPVFKQQLTVRNGVISRLAIVQRSAQKLPGRGVWPTRLQLLLAYPQGKADTIPLTITAETTVVTAARGKPAPAFVYANVGDQAYGLIELDSASRATISEHAGEVYDNFLRAMLWGTLWDEVRAARMNPAYFVNAALDGLARETDEQIASSLLGRLTRATNAYLTDAARADLLPNVESSLLQWVNDGSKTFGLRKSSLDAFISVARTPKALAQLETFLDSTNLAGAPLRAPTRWSMVTALLSRGASSAQQRLAAEARRDTTSEGRRRLFAATAATPSAAMKAEYFRRYFADLTLNEEWAQTSLRSFNAINQDSLTLPFLTTALDSLPWIQRNRRIFFLGNWLGAFLDGQTSARAVQVVDQFLRTHPSLPTDLRQKILQNADELRRTVAIRRKYGERR